MEKEKAFWSSIIGFFAVCIVGVINHYVYHLTGNNIIAGMFTPVNESVWEHLKQLYFPYLIYIICEYFVYGRKIKGFLFSRVIGVMIGMVFVPAMFFIYTSIFGRSFVPVDILLFIISVLLSFYISFDRILKDKDNYRMRNLAAVILLLAISILFVGLTFFPPETALFRDMTAV